MKNFWNDLKKPFFILAPMDDVTDTVFREVVGKVAPADVAFTEFTNVDGLQSAGRSAVERKLLVNKSEQQLSVPIVAQIWGSNPDNYFKAAQELAASGLFAGIDINMGCPEKGICKRGCCGGLIKPENRKLSSEIIKAVQAGAGDLPVSVKTRIGFGTIDTEGWAAHLLKHNLAALAIHGRTVREMSKVPAHWDEIGAVAKLRDEIAPQTLIIGNGDVTSRAQGEDLAKKYNLDGIMIGRGVFQDLFVFDATSKNHSLEDMFEILLGHIDLYESTWGNAKSYEPLKKFFKIYVQAFPGASELRHTLMQTKNSAEAQLAIKNFQQSHKTLALKA